MIILMMIKVDPLFIKDILMKLLNKKIKIIVIVMKWMQKNNIIKCICLGKKIGKINEKYDILFSFNIFFQYLYLFNEIIYLINKNYVFIVIN